MIDLKQMQATFLLQWAGCLFQAQALGKWSHIPKNIFAPFGDKYLCFFSNLKSRAFKGLQMITSHFWNSVLKMWLDLNNHDPSMTVPNLLWNNSHIKYQGNVLMFTDWITGKILYVNDIKGPSGLIPFQDICNKIVNSPSRFLECRECCSMQSHKYTRGKRKTFQSFTGQPQRHSTRQNKGNQNTVS